MTTIYDTSILPYNGDGKTYMESLEIDSWNKFVDVAMESVGMSDNIEIKDFLYKYPDSIVYEKAVNPNSEISKLLKEAKNEYKTSLKKARKAVKTGDKNTAHKEVNNAISALMKAQKSSEKIMKEDSTSFNSAMGFVIVTLIDCAKLLLVTFATGGFGTVFVAGYQAIKDIVAVLQTSMNKKDMQPEDYNMLWIRHKTLYAKLIKQLEVFDKSIDEDVDKATGKNDDNTSFKDKVSAKAKDIKSDIDAKAENIKAKFKKESTDEVDENAASVVGSLLPQGQGASGVDDDTVEDMVDSDEDSIIESASDIEWRYVSPLKSKKLIDEFEKLQNYKFPSDYKSIVFKYNGGYPPKNKNLFNAKTYGENVFAGLYSFNKDDDYDKIWSVNKPDENYTFDRNNEPFDKSKYVAFGMTPNGDYLCFVKSNNSIVVVDHERATNNIYRVAGSFSEFINNLYSETDDNKFEKDIKESYDEGLIYTTSMMCEAGGIKETADKIIQKIKSIGHGKDGEVRRNVVQKASKLQTSIILNQIRMKVEVAKDPKNGKNTATYKNALRETIRLEKELRKIIDLMSDAEKSAFIAFCRELNDSSKETETSMIIDAKESRKATITTNQGDGKKINKKLGIKTEASEESSKTDDKKNTKEISSSGLSKLSKIYYAQLDLLEANQEVIVYKRAGIPDKIDKNSDENIKKIEEKIKTMKEALNPAEKVAFTGFTSKAQGVYNKYTSQAVKDITNSEDADDAEATLIDIVDQENAEIAKMYPKYLEDYLEESVSDYYSEAANIDKEIQEYIDRLNDKGYKTLYSSPGHNNIRAKEDPNKDGVYYGKIYNDARIMFDDDYDFGEAPKYWHWRQVDNKSYLDITPITFNGDKGTRDKQYAEWKKKYLKSLSDWIDELPDISDNGKKKDDSDDSKDNNENTDTTDKKDTEEEVKDVEESVMTDLFASMGMIYE